MFYYYGDLVTAAETVYKCTGYSHCDVDPTSIKGNKGWTTLPYTASLITTKQSPNHWMTYDSNYPYKIGDIVSQNT